jgi:hypothetical protein
MAELIEANGGTVTSPLGAVPIQTRQEAELDFDVFWDIGALDVKREIDGWHVNIISPRAGTEIATQIATQPTGTGKDGAGNTS